MVIFSDKIRSFSLLNSCLNEYGASSDQRNMRWIHVSVSSMNAKCFSISVSLFSRCYLISSRRLDTWAVSNLICLNPRCSSTIFQIDFPFIFRYDPFCVLILLGCFKCFHEWLWCCFGNEMNVTFHFLVWKNNFLSILSTSECLKQLIDVFLIP